MEDSSLLGSSAMSLVKYRCAPAPIGNMFQDLPRLRETADNTERYIFHDICVTYINMVKFN
jgi:hypothetical protein